MCSGPNIVVHKRYMRCWDRSTDELLLKIKDNGIDMDSAVPVVYIPLHEGTAPFIDMPLDFILPVRRIPTFQYSQQSFHPVR